MIRVNRWIAAYSIATFLLLWWPLHGTTVVQAEPAADKAAPPGVADEQDRLVLETALLHLLAADDFDMMGKHRRDAIIILKARTPEKTGMIRPEQIRGDVGEGHVVPDDMQHDLRRRNEQPGTYNAQVASFRDMRFDQRVVVSDAAANVRFGAFEKAYPRARGYAEAFLPGYSRDGSHAVVRAWVGPSPHGAMATVLLERKGDTWLVKWHYIAWFA
jgi:hypothetical protein